MSLSSSSSSSSLLAALKNNPALSFLLVNLLPAGSVVALVSSAFYFFLAELKSCFVSRSYVYANGNGGASIWRWMMLWLAARRAAEEAEDEAARAGGRGGLGEALLGLLLGLVGGRRSSARLPAVIALNSAIDPSQRRRVHRGPGPSGSDLPAQHSKADDISFLPHHNVSYRFWYRGHVLWCRIVHDRSTAHHTVYSQEADKVLEICVLGLRGQDVARQLIAEAKEMYSEKLKKQTIIWTSASQYGNAQWKQLDARPSRPMDTVILEGSAAETLAADIKSFTESSEWYYSRGIPYRRGYLLYGPPGCGKTSCITALAGELHMVICIIDLSNTMITNDTLLTLFASAPKHSILLLEDIDVTFKSRDEDAEDEEKRAENANDAETSDREKGLPPWDLRSKRQKQKRSSSGVTFSGLLNAIDGVAAQEGKVVIMTTNHIEELDSALIRPGRVDVRAFFQLGSKSCASRLFKRFYRDSVDDQEVVDTMASEFATIVPEKKLSMAQIQGHLMNYKDSPAAAVENVRELLEFSNGGDLKRNQSIELVT